MASNPRDERRPLVVLATIEHRPSQYGAGGRPCAGAPAGGCFGGPSTGPLGVLTIIEVLPELTWPGFASGEENGWRLFDAGATEASAGELVRPKLVRAKLARATLGARKRVLLPKPGRRVYEGREDA